MDTIPWADAGVVVVLFTLIIRLVLFPLSKKALLTQKKIKKFEPELKKIKEQYKDREEQAKKTMELYKEKGINPFSSFFLILIQLPIIIGLYRIFLSSGLPTIQESILYSFVSVPASVNMIFLGMVDITTRNWPLALLVGIATFIQMRLSMPALDLKNTQKGDFKADLAKSMHIQMRFVFPLLAIFISYGLSGAIALYWLTSNLFSIGQEIYIKNKFRKEDNTV